MAAQATRTRSGGVAVRFTGQGPMQHKTTKRQRSRGDNRRASIKEQQQ